MVELQFFGVVHADMMVASIVEKECTRNSRPNFSQNLSSFIHILLVKVGK